MSTERKKKPPFGKLLIANRGEIACRIARTAHRLGIQTVAIYSDADADALHVKAADEVVRVGPANPSESYLNARAILNAAQTCNANAIHPGYGFLSENADFAQCVEAAGLVFVGPSAAAIRRMGAKNSAKQLMEKAGVPIVPGYHGDGQDAALLLEESRRIGFPVLIKPVAGGGGKGMRAAKSEEEFGDMLAAAKREAASSFSNCDVIIERLICQPRHIEVQVFGDTHGNIIHLFERDCSMQRRHQKIIEECPAPGMTSEFRSVITNTAIRAARAINYTGAGTVEFIADSSNGLREDRFWFMEMNTRLQVEHCVTEEALGIDLVEWQLLVASGQPLPQKSAPLQIQNHAIEARLYAEDPANGFLPSVGRIVRAQMPTTIRVDTGVKCGDAITPFYDPMIAKFIARGPNREVARQRLKRAFGATDIRGLTTNLAFLTNLVESEEFTGGQFDTNTVDQRCGQPGRSSDLSPVAQALAVLAMAGQLRQQGPETGFTLWQHLERTIAFKFGEQISKAVIRVMGANQFSIKLADETEIECQRLANDQWRMNNKEVDAARVVIDGRGVFLFMAEIHKIVPLDHLDQIGQESIHDGIVRAPMPGMVRSIVADEGSIVGVGDPVVIMEAMKMEMVLKAPQAGVIEKVYVAVNEQVAQGTKVVDIKVSPKDQD